MASEKGKKSQKGKKGKKGKENHRAPSKEDIQKALEITDALTMKRRDPYRIFYDTIMAGNLASGIPLLTFIMDKVLDVTRAERGFLFLKEPPGKYVCHMARMRGSKNILDPDSQMSRQIIERTVRAGRLLVTEDVVNDPEIDYEGSVARFKIKSLMASPIRDGDDILGVCYVERRRSAVHFEEEVREIFQWFVDKVMGKLVPHAREQNRREERLALLSTRLAAVRDFPHIVGSGAAMLGIFRQIDKLSRSDASILIRGESGTGKELIAHAIHKWSLRKDHRFVSVNCAALVETLDRSELFGHEKGAFTGAINRKIGKFEYADGGTIFLDEIGDMLLATQAKLLRVTQEREIERIGNTEPIPVDVRIIAATNKDLEEAIQMKEFRKDLYFRINVITITLPPLRERLEDILEIAQHYVDPFRKKHDRPYRLSAETINCLSEYAWPGNVRELINVLERAVLMTPDDFIQPEDLGPVFAGKRKAGRDEGKQTELRYHHHRGTDCPYANLQRRHQAEERILLCDALREAGGNIAKAAKILEFPRKSLYFRMQKLKIRPEDYSDSPVNNN